MRYSIIRDIIIISVSIIIAIFIVKTDFINWVLFTYRLPPFLLALLAGIFYASIFTAPLSIAAIIALAQDGFLISTVIFGGIGAALGDLLIFKFLKLGIAKNIVIFLKQKKVFHIQQKRILRIFPICAGLFIIASPLPDEIGIFFLGTSKIKEGYFVILAYFLNAVGIYLVGLSVL